MSIKVVINGFGRIGRLAFRQLADDKDFEIVAVNDTADEAAAAYLLKYDSAQGRFENHEVGSTKDGNLLLDGREIKMLNERDAAKLPWKDLGVDVVLECTGAYTSKEKAEAHIKAGAKKVLISAPATGDLKTIVFNVNHEILDGSEQVVSAASCTTNCLAPMAKVLEEKYGIEQGFMTTIHAYTNDQNTLDNAHPKGDFRRGRAAAANIVPNSTGAAKAIGLVIPSLAGRLDGSAQRVPVITGSLTELVAIVNAKVTVEDINKIMKESVNETLAYTEDPIVSSDIIGSKYGSIFDGTQTKVMEMNENQSLVKIASWYDNESSYTSQMVRTLKYLGKMI